MDHVKSFIEAATPTPDFSVIVAVEGAPDLVASLRNYRPALDGLGKDYELFCVVDERDGALVEDLKRLSAEWPEVAIIGQRIWVDEDTALGKAANRCRGEHILTLAGWPEIEPQGLAKLVAQAGTADMVVAARRSQPSTLRSRVLNWALERCFGTSVSDIFCRTRLIRREVFGDVGGYGVRQHFLPVITSELGYSVAEVSVEPSSASAPGAATFVFKPFAHLRALLDAAALFVVLKFLRRPLRFFGAIGLPVLLLGLAITLGYLGMRIFGSVPLADRPGLIFAVLMVVLGIQIIALGLVGEIIVFANNRKLKQYSVKSLIRKLPERGAPIVE